MATVFFLMAIAACCAPALVVFTEVFLVAVLAGASALRPLAFVSDVFLEVAWLVFTGVLLAADFMGLVGVSPGMIWNRINASAIVPLGRP